jgi:hypothetical protein
MKTAPVNQVLARAGQVNPATRLKAGADRRTDQAILEAAVLVAVMVQREAAPMVEPGAAERNSPENSQA